MPLAFDLVGNWTSSRILLRLLAVVDSPWQVTDQGFVHRETGERCVLGMGAAVPAIAEAFAWGACPIRPSIDDDLFQEITHHRSIVSVMLPDEVRGARPALTLARATDAIVNGGALAVRCRTSGLAHAADTFQALVARAEAAAPEGDAALAEALYESFVLLRADDEAPHTLGMHALDAPDVLLPATAPELAAVRLEDAARTWFRAGPSGTAQTDPFTDEDPRHNPLGRVLLA